MDKREELRLDSLKMFEISKGTGNKKKMVGYALRYANMERAAGRLPMADICLREALSFITEEEDPDGVILLKRQIGDIALRKNQVEEARRLFVEAEELCKKHDMKSRLAGVYIDLGKIDIATKQLDVARVHYSDALAIGEELENKGLISSALLNLGEMEITEEKYEDAIPKVKRALPMFAELKDPVSTLFALRDLCFAYGKLKNAELVTFYANQATDLMSKIQYEKPLADHVQKVIETALKEI